MVRAHIPAALRRYTIARARNQCEYCLLPASSAAIPHHVDHILPLRHGGVTAEHNLAYACFECNVNKGANIAAIDPLDEQITRLFDPRIHLWTSHFALHDGRILGLTAIGRTTAQLLRLNSDVRVRQRQLLIKAGAYPLE